VRKHNGRIDLASAPGAGTRFRVVLPRVREGELAPPETSAEVTHG
jgi:signal transduction histidine kinase